MPTRDRVLAADADHEHVGLGDRKIANVKATGAQAVFMGNVGCLMQVMRHLKKDLPEVWAAHPIDALYASYTGEMPRELKASGGR